MTRKYVRVEITITTDRGKVTIERDDEPDRLGRSTKSPLQALNAATADVRSWLKRNPTGDR